MTIDERLELLAERHEGLTQSCELMLAESLEHSKQIAEQSRQIAEQSQQIAEQSQQIAEHSRQLERDAEHILALARIAELHDRRFSDLER